MQKIIQANKVFPVSMRLKTLSAAVLSVLLISQASAAGLGKLTVLSGLGQPLRAEIELTAVSADEAQSLQPKIASLEAFRQANIEFSPALQSLRFAIEQRGIRQFIRITSVQPIDEPFVDVLLELNGVNGRLVREYTFLLDPPEMRALQPAQTAQTASLASSRAAQSMPSATTNPTSATPSATASASMRANVGSASQQTTKPEPVQKFEATSARLGPLPQALAGGQDSSGKQYRVKAGDTLSKVANRTRAQGISLDQMLVALYRANPEAFVSNNMNRLRSGKILSIPSAEASASIDALDAQGTVIAQAADFNDYRNKLAGQVATGVGRKASESRQSATGKIAAKVQESPTPANEALNKLKLSKATTGVTANATALQENKIAQEKADAEASARLKDLEKNVGDLQKLLEIKSKDLAARQIAAEKPTATVIPTPTKTSTPISTPTTIPATPTAPIATVTTAASPAVAIVVATPTPLPVPANLEVSKSNAPANHRAPKTAAAPDSPGMFDDPINNPAVQGGVVLALLLGGLALLRSRRKKLAQQSLNTSMAAASLKENSLFGSSGGQTVDTNHSVFNSSFAPGSAHLDGNEVDPVAEADVYIAYGRDAQAEEILKEALRTQPERNAVRVKLLEIYAGRKDLRAFESAATELYSRTKGEGEDWAQAATLGLGIDPANALYVGGDTMLTMPAIEKSSGPAEVDGSSGTAAGLADAATSGIASEKVDASAGTTANSDNSLDFDSNSLDFVTSKNVPESLSPMAIDTPANVSLAALAVGTDAAVSVPTGAASGIDQPSHESIDQAPPQPTNSETHQTEVSPPVAAPLDENVLAGLNFDFLDEPSSDAAKSAASAQPTANDHLLTPADATVVGDFSLDLNEPNVVFDNDTDVAVAGGTSVGQPEPLPFDLSGITLELPENSEPPVMADKPMPSITNFGAMTDIGGAGVGSGTGASAGAGNTNHQEDFSALDLSTAVLDDEASTAGIGNIAEMATKLDLAVAYQEIGDQEGARELLDEVFKGGNAEQSEKAKALLARLN